MFAPTGQLVMPHGGECSHRPHRCGSIRPTHYSLPQRLWHTSASLPRWM